MTVRIRFTVFSPRLRLAPWSLLGWSRRVAARMRQRQRLLELDDRMLRDIGVSRGQATAEASKPWWTLLRR